MEGAFIMWAPVISGTTWIKGTITKKNQREKFILAVASKLQTNTCICRLLCARVRFYAVYIWTHDQLDCRQAFHHSLKGKCRRPLKSTMYLLSYLKLWVEAVLFYTSYCQSSTFSLLQVFPLGRWELTTKDRGTKDVSYMQHFQFSSFFSSN